MYQDTITLFNRYESSLGDMWYPTILRGVNLVIDKASIASRYGENSRDKVVLNVRYDNVGGERYINGKRFLLPKEWDGQTNDMLSQTITFSDGDKFDFFIVGEYDEAPVADDDYRDGFYDFMRENKDLVFAITSVSYLSVIPHFEITGK